MEETDRLFACEFCSVKSYLVATDVFRYMLPSKAPQSKELWFFPYWRFKGMLFSCAGNGLAHKFVDVSHQAVLSNLFPVSLGLRSQALKLKFVKPDTAGRFLKPTQSFEDVKQNFEDRFGRSLPKPVLHHAHIGETLSLIYAPFYMQTAFMMPCSTVRLQRHRCKILTLINCPLRARTGAFILFQLCAPTAAGIWMEKGIRWFCCAKIVHLPGIPPVKS